MAINAPSFAIRIVLNKRVHLRRLISAIFAPHRAHYRRSKMPCETKENKIKSGIKSDNINTRESYH